MTHGQMVSFLVLTLGIIIMAILAYTLGFAIIHFYNKLRGNNKTLYYGTELLQTTLLGQTIILIFLLILLKVN